MKNMFKMLVLMSAFILLFASGVFALPIYPVSAGDTIQIVKNTIGSDVGGGEFSVIKNGAFKFNTFCLERDEGVTSGGFYQIAGITDSAQNGGVNTDDGDPLSNQTKWLYFHYSLGDLDTKGTAYQYGNFISADALQLAIWMLEEEISSTGNTPKGALADALIAAANTAVLAKESVGEVAVLNLITTDRYGRVTNRQDMLVSSVPEPGTILLLGAGLLGLGMFGRRRMRS
jgi:hypothetical protein